MAELADCALVVANTQLVTENAQVTD
jgi:hypothetical protein